MKFGFLANFSKLAKRRYLTENIGHLTKNLRQPNMIKKNHLNSKKMLGRWRINHDEKIIEENVRSANEDHCGCCEK
jgi:hypothetical protein